MLDLFGNHIVGFLMRRRLICLGAIVSNVCHLVDNVCFNRRFDVPYFFC